MVSSIHNKFYTRGNHAILANNELVANEVKMIFYIFFKVFYILKIRLRQAPVSTTIFWQQIFDEKRPRSLWQQLRLR